jgi:hypothetical protein
MRAALNAAPSALEEMGARGAERVRAQHDARIEGCKLAALLRSSRR